MAESDLGTDFSALNDLDANLSVVTGRQCLMQALVRRIDTPRGGLFYRQDYGRDIGAYVNTATEPSVIEQTAESEMLGDERVENVAATLTVSEPADRSLTGGKSWGLDLTLETAEAPFDFTLAVEAVTGKLLLEGAG